MPRLNHKSYRKDIYLNSTDTCPSRLDSLIKKCACVCVISKIFCSSTLVLIQRNKEKSNKQ